VDAVTTFTCPACGETFDVAPAWIDEAELEMLTVFGYLPEHHRRYVCGACYEWLMVINR